MKRNRIVTASLLTILVLAVTPLVMAQDGQPTADTNAQALATLINLLVGFAISFVVHWLKGIGIVRDNPKKVAALLSAIGSVVAGYLGTRAGGVVSLFVLSFLTQLATSIGTFETLIKPASSEASDS